MSLFQLAFNQVSQPIAVAMLMSLVTVYGTEATAAFGIYIKLEALVMIPLFSISSALGPFLWGKIMVQRFFQDSKQPTNIHLSLWLYMESF